MSKSRSGAPKRVAVGLLAGALAVLGIAYAPSAGATADVTTDRYAGTTRYGTAAAIAGQDDFNGATTAILATGENFPDALAASGIAGAKGPAPIILTQSGTYTQAAHDALNSFTDVTDVIIVGGTAAISDSVKQAVTDDGFNVTRVAGTNRFGTAAEIAKAVGAANVGTVDGKKTALIANGLNYPDALAGGTVAYAAGLPILLVTPSSIPSETSAALTDLGIQHAIILGGTAAVSDAVKAELDTKTGSASERVAGVNRFGTAAAVGEWAVDNLGWDPSEIELASGVNFPDALAGGPLGGERQAPILLLASVPDETKGFADDHSDTITDVNCLGGTAACAEADLQTVATAAENTANDGPAANGTATDRPELVSATVVKTTTASQVTAGELNQEGTVVRFTFDEAVTGAGSLSDASLFHLYEADSSSNDGDYVQVDPSTSTAALVRFDTYNTTSSLAGVTTATVSWDAARDGSGLENPEGDAAIGVADQSPLSAGATSAPDLVSVGNIRQGTDPAAPGSPDVNFTAVDFTFDRAAYVEGTTGFSIVLVSSTDGGTTDPIQCVSDPSTTATAGGSLPGGSGTTVITVVCPASPTVISSSTVARGVVQDEAVATSASNTVENPLEAAEVANSGHTPSPDLETVLFNDNVQYPAGHPFAGQDADAVVYVFDQAISSPDENGGICGSGFIVYFSDGTQDECTFNGVSRFDVDGRAPNNDNVVFVLFPDGTLENAVGASVREDTVTGFNGGTNFDDEVGVTPVAGTEVRSGLTGGPDLIKVESQPFTDAFGTAKARVIYTFDEKVIDADALNATANEGGLYLYLADGISMTCNNVEPLTADNRASDTEIVCNGYDLDDGGTATTQQILAATLGTVDGTADGNEVAHDASGNGNPEGGELITHRAAA